MGGAKKKKTMYCVHEEFLDVKYVLDDSKKLEQFSFFVEKI